MRTLLPLALLTALLIGGCPQATDLLDINTVTVRVVNDTDFEIDPNILFEESDSAIGGFFAGIFDSGEEVGVNSLFPGEVAEFSFDCDDIGRVFADSATQFTFDGEFEADDTDIIRRGEDYDCGDIITYQFLGDFEAFGVVVLVNGLVQD